MSTLLIAALSCVITIVIQGFFFAVFKYQASNIFIDFGIFAAIYLPVFTLIEKIGTRKK